MSVYRIVALTLVLTIGFTIGLSTIASAQGLIEQALKVFGIAYVVRTFGDDLNKFVNDLAGQHGVEWEGTTKVVPVISVGSGAFIGAAQVQGPPDRVDDVRGVAQIEARISDLRGRYLWPVNTTNPSRNVERIRGVGVSALLDFRI